MTLGYGTRKILSKKNEANIGNIVNVVPTSHTINRPLIPCSFYFLVSFQTTTSVPILHRWQ